MRQRWEHLLFLHWEWDPDDIQRTLPRGLTTDCHDGKTWLGIVPFAMRDVRPRGLPGLPWLSNFLELNVRAYVRDAEGRPGVWFYSLDCNQPVAVVVARRFFHLPYQHATMRAGEFLEDGFTGYECRRYGGAQVASYSCTAGAGQPSVSAPGSLEAFLVERYRLFAASPDRRLLTGEVRHKPYQITAAKVLEWSALPIAQAGFSAPSRPPDHAVWSRGVEVGVCRPQWSPA